MRRRFLAFFAAAAVLALPGVARAEGQGDYSNSASVERNGVRYEAATDTSVYRHGDVLSMRYRVTNVGRDSVRFWFGSTTARLTGEVTEDSGMLPVVIPIEGARVNLTAEGDMTARPVSGVTVWTDREGRFGFGGVKPGFYVLTVSKEGYVTGTTKVDLTKPGDHRAGVSLKRAPQKEEAFPNRNAWAHERTLAELALDREGYAPGDSLLVRYRLINTTKDTLRLMFRSGQRYDFEMHGPQGRVWGWSDNKRFIAALGARGLAPGDTLRVDEAFFVPDVGPGGEGYCSLTGFMAVTPDAPGAVTRGETEAQVKFRVGRTGGVRPPPPVSRPTDYFPLASGMRWVYGDSFHVVEVGGMMKSLPPIYIVDYLGQKRNFIKQEDGKVLEWRDGKRRLLYDFGAKIGATWTIEPLGDGSEILDGTVVTVVSVTEEVSTPYGDFKGCVHLKMQPRDGLADAGFTDMWFAQGVGLVKWSEVWIGGVRSYALTGFSVRVETARLKAEMTTDRQAYAPEDTVYIHYRLTNVTKEPLSLRFLSGQRYDFILEGPKGKVWQWSDGKAFTRMVWDQDFAPGDSIVFQEAFALPRVGPDGEGTYVLTGFMALPPGAVLFSTPEVVRREETETRAKFAIGRTGGVPPGPSTGPPTALRKGDFDRDGRVGFADFFMFADAFGKRSGAPGFEPAFDLDRDGNVGFSDFFLFIDMFGERK